MATLTNTKIRDTYDGLIKTTDNAAVNSNKKRITDGVGNQTPLLISETEIEVDANLTAEGIIISGAPSNSVVMSDGTTASVAGFEDKEFTYTQNVASDTWNVTHNLGKRPSVTVVDSGDSVVIGDISYTNSNELTITFSSAFSGKAYLN